MALLLFASPALAQDGGQAADPDAPRVGASLDHTEAYVGDRLTLTVSAIASDALTVTVRLPSTPTLGLFQVLDSTSSDRDLGDGNRSRRFVLKIAAYQTGALELPPLVLEYTARNGQRRSVATTPIPVTVKSLLVETPAGGTADLQPLHGPRAVLERDRRVIGALVGIGVLATLGMAGWVAWRALRRRRKPVAPTLIVRPPAEVALERLGELRRRGGFERDGYRPFFFAIAEIVRAYLGARYGFDVEKAAARWASGGRTGLELTTGELLAELGHATESIAESIHADIRLFLEACDLVKFAKAPSNDLEARSALDRAEAIVRATPPAVVEPAATVPPGEVSAHG